MQKLLMILIASLGFAGCSSDSSAPTQPPVTPPANVAPTVAVNEAFAVHQGEPVSLEAVGSDTDGTIASYAWEQTGGTEVEITDADLATATFSAPMVAVDGETLSFSVTVTDDDGATATGTIDIEVIYAATYLIGIPEILAMNNPLLFITTGVNYDGWDPDNIIDGEFIGTIKFEWIEDIMIEGVLAHRYEHESFVSMSAFSTTNRWSFDFFRDGDTGDLLLLRAVGDNDCLIDESTLPFNDEPEMITVVGRDVVEGAVGRMVCNDGETNSLLWTWAAQVSDLDDDWLAYTQTFVWDWEDGFRIVAEETRHISPDGIMLEIKKEESEILNFGAPEEELMWYSNHSTPGIGQNPPP